MIHNVWRCGFNHCSATSLPSPAPAPLSVPSPFFPGGPRGLLWAVSTLVSAGIGVLLAARYHPPPPIHYIPTPGLGPGAPCSIMRRVLEHWCGGSCAAVQNDIWPCTIVGPDPVTSLGPFWGRWGPFGAHLGVPSVKPQKWPYPGPDGPRRKERTVRTPPVLHPGLGQGWGVGWSKLGSLLPLPHPNPSQQASN